MSKKVDLASLAEVELRREERDFRDRVQPGKVFWFTLEGPDLDVYSDYHKLRAEYVGRFVTGTGNKDGKPQVVPIAGYKKPFTLNEMACEQIAILECLQAPDDEEDRWTLPELLVLRKKAPNAWEEILAWAYGLFNDPYVYPKDAEGNDSGDGESEASPPPSPTDSSTQAGCSTPETASGVSTPDSAP